MPEDHVVEDKPPYLSFKTLTNFLGNWDGPLPPRLDKSALERYSGGTQAVLLATLKVIGYVDQAGTVLPTLRESVSSETVRKAYLDQWARQFYAEQIALAEQTATSQMLYESFARHGYNGSTLRKAVVFYLALVEYLGLPNSTMFRPPRQSATPTSRRRVKATPPPKTDPVAPPSAGATSSPKGETTVVHIGDQATITIVVDAQWMKLPVTTITSMREAIDNLVQLGTGSD